MFQTAARFAQQIGFVRDVYVGRDGIADLFCLVMHVHHAGEPLRQIERMKQERLARNIHHRLGPVVGQRRHSGAKASSKEQSGCGCHVVRSGRINSERSRKSG